MQEFAGLGELLAASGVREQAIMADAVEATGQNVQQEATHELVGREGHRLVARLAGDAVVLAAKGDATFIEGEQAGVRDRHPMGVARQIGEHRCRAGEGALGVDNPFTLAQRREPLREALRVGERRLVAEELQPAGAIRGGEFFEATDSAVWCLRLDAAAISRATSSRLSTTGSVCGNRTGCIFAISSPCPSVTSKKNFRAVIAAFSDTGEVPLSTKCN